jgi:hypothetical protein
LSARVADKPPYHKAVAALLRKAKENKPQTWYTFGQTELQINSEDVRAVAFLKKPPWNDLVSKLVRYCVACKISIPADDGPHFAAFLQELELEEETTRTTSNPLVVALGLNLTISEASIDAYSGGYLHFTLDDDGKVVASKYALSRKLGPDLTPLYRSWRTVPGLGRRRFVGAYFANDANLYLVGTPLRSVDLRLCVLNIIPGDKQPILRGLVLGVSYRGTIITSRCLFVRSDSIDPVSRKAFVKAPLSKEEFQKKFSEGADFLFGLEELAYIKISTGE